MCLPSDPEKVKLKQEEKAKQLKDDEEKVEEEIGDETKEGEAEDCHAASTYSRWKRKSEESSGWSWKRRWWQHEGWC